MPLLCYSTIYYSVWFAWDTNPGFQFQLSVDSTDTLHVITVPAHPDDAKISLLVRATDEWQYPHNDCAACHRLVHLKGVGSSAYYTYLNGLLSAPWDTVMPALEFLSLVQDFEDVGPSMRVCVVVLRQSAALGTLLWACT